MSHQVQWWDDSLAFCNPALATTSLLHLNRAVALAIIFEFSLTMFFSKSNQMDNSNIQLNDFLKDKLSNVLTDFRKGHSVQH